MITEQNNLNQSMRICIGPSVSNPKNTHVCTVGEFLAVSKSAKVDQACKELRKLPLDDSQKETKDKLKKKLPVFCFNASHFANDYRNNENATPSGLCMIDWDKVEDPRAWIESFGSTREEQTRQLRLCGLVGLHLSPSAHGYHGIISMRPGESIEQAQARVARNMGKEVYDKGAHAVSQSSYVVPYYYWHFLDEQELMAEAVTTGETIDIEAEPIEVMAEPIEVVAEPMPAEQQKLVIDSTEQNKAAEQGKQQAVTKHAGGPDIEDAEVLSETLEADEQDAYDGVPMNLLVNAIITELMKLNDVPVQGTRHNRYLELQRHLRYFCEFDVETMLRLAPEWGLSKQERLDACESAAKYDRVPGLPRALQSLLTQLKDQLKLAEGLSLNSYERDPLPSNLPKLLALIYKLVPESLREAAMFCCLPLLGTLTTALRYRHHEVKVEHTSFQTYIVGHMASGKSVMKVVKELLMKPIEADDERLLQLENEWRDEFNAAGEGKKHREPHNVIRQVEADFTMPALHKLLINSRKQHLLLFSEESDSIRMSKEFSSVMRNAFDGSKTGQTRASAQSVNGKAVTLINSLIGGTPSAMHRMLSNPEDGLVSRQMFYSIPDKLGSDEPEYGHLTPTEYRTIDAECMRLHNIGLIENVQNLPDYQPEHKEVWISKMPRTEGLIKSWSAARKLEFVMGGGKDIALEKFSRRVPTYIRRASMLLWVLENGKETTRSMNLLCWFADRMLGEMLDQYGYQYEEIYHQSSLANTPYKRQSKNADLLNMLPSTFSVEDIIMTQQRRGIACTRKNAQVIASRLKGYIEPTGEPNHWRKVQVA